MAAIFIISLAFILIYVLFLRYIGSRFKIHEVAPAAWELPKVFILIPARNEEKHIGNCLLSIQNQDFDFGKLEVIVIDDFSDDKTVETAKTFENKFNLKIIKSELPGKKQALLAGIRHAGSNIMITTDADCTMGKDWLRNMLIEFVNSDLNMLCGLIQLNSSGIFQKLQQAESAAIVGISAVMLNEQQPCTCNGANLMFRKDVFDHIGGYGAHAGLLSGDDDLLMQQFARLDMDKTRYIVQKDTVVMTAACGDMKGFMQQRSRWLSKRKAYLFPYNQLVQAIVLLHLPAFYSLCFLAFLPHGEYAAGLIIIKYLADIYYGRKIRKVVEFKLSMILLMPFYQAYIFGALVYSRFKKVEWKGRTLGPIDN